MNTYKIIVSYDGTDFFGWQFQPNKTSVAGVLQNTFAKTFGSSIKLLGASRTDAGVHAHGQVAVFSADVVISAEKMLKAWNNILPESIVICSLQKIDQKFNPRFGVAQKVYEYHFTLVRQRPTNTRYVYFFRHQFDFEKFKQCLQVFVGEHDFRSFSTGTPIGNSTIRRIDKITISYSDEHKTYTISVKGPRFLQYMIRRIVGACLHVASRDDIPVSHLKKALEEKNPRQAVPKAPAKGLVLESIRYKDIEHLREKL